MPQQRNLFDKEPEAWEADDQSERLIATVILSTGPEQEFDYLVPDRTLRGDRAGPPGPRAFGTCESAGIGILHPRGKPPDRHAQAQIDTGRHRQQSLAFSADAAIDALAGRLLSMSLGDGAGDGAAGRRAGRAGTRLTTFLSIDAGGGKTHIARKISAQAGRRAKGSYGEAKSPMTAAELARAAKCGQATNSHLAPQGI